MRLASSSASPAGCAVMVPVTLYHHCAWWMPALEEQSRRSQASSSICLHGHTITMWIKGVLHTPCMRDTQLKEWAIPGGG